MKTIHFILAFVMLLLTALTVAAQDEAGATIPFDKKLPPTDRKPIRDRFLPNKVKNNISRTQLLSIKSLNTKDIQNYPDRLKQLLQENRNNLMQMHRRTTATAGNLGNSSTPLNADFHLTKDINALAESFPNNSY